MRFKNGLISGVLLLAVFAGFQLCAASGQRSFEKDSIKLIEKKYESKPLLLVMWSIECTPCRAELKLLGELKQKYPEMNLVLVATDNISQQKKLDKILLDYHLSEVDAWAFAGSNAEQLRYAVDAEWFGELPRSYFYNAAHERVGISGKLKAQSILNWLNSGLADVL